MPLSAGTRLGQYEILAPIGAGGMGEVYRARDTELKREVALKVLPEAVARDPERMARFQREAEVLASLNHPNIAHIFGVAESDSGRSLAMELVEGAAPKGPLAFDEAWKIASQIVAALEYAHERGIVHRDLKPANIMITSEGAVKLLDFGLAKAFTNQRDAAPSAENSPTLTLGATEVGVILGTAAYMSPEQAKGKQVDKRADIWSFGVILYELLTAFAAPEDADIHHPLWSPDGRELFYSPGRSMFGSVSVTTQPSVGFGSPVRAPRSGFITAIPASVRPFDILPDGKRFIGVVAPGEAASGAPPQIQVVLNWFEDLKQRAPVK